jgi:hypothetical protein
MQNVADLFPPESFDVYLLSFSNHEDCVFLTNTGYVLYNEYNDLGP